MKNPQYFAQHNALLGVPFHIHSQPSENIVGDKILYGATLVNMNGTDTIFNIPHGMSVKPKSFAITFEDASNLNFTQSKRTIDNINIIFTCNDAPALGAQTVYWQVYK